MVSPCTFDHHLDEICIRQDNYDVLCTHISFLMFLMFFTLLLVSAFFFSFSSHISDFRILSFRISRDLVVSLVVLAMGKF